MKCVYTQDLRVRIKFTAKPRRGLIGNIVKGMSNEFAKRALSDVRIKSFTITRMGAAS